MMIRVFSWRPIWLLVAAAVTTVALIAIQVGSLLETIARLERDDEARVRAALVRLRERVDPGDPLERRISALFSPGGFDAERARVLRGELRVMLDDELARQGVGPSESVLLWREGGPADRAPQRGIDGPAIPLSRGLQDDGVRVGVLMPERGGLTRLAELPVLGPVSVALATVILAFVFWAVRMASRLERIGRRQREFVENFTHEIRTPAFAVSVAATALEESDDLPSHARHLVARVRSAAARVRSHVDRLNQLVVMDRAREGAVLAPGTADLPALVDQVSAEYRARFREAGGGLEVVAGAGSGRVRGDEVAWRSVLGNLLDNALRYSTAPPEACVRTRDDGGSLELAVEDRGRGVPASERERIFERYHRLAGGTVHDTKGLGIGLALVRETVRAAGGSVRHEPRKGGGSRFVVRVPLAADVAGTHDG